MAGKRGKKKLKIGVFSFTGCEGCQFTILFIDKIFELLANFDVRYFHLLKEKNKHTNFDIAFVEGAITTKKEIKKLKVIREKSKYLVALGACACHGGIPSMRNFIGNKELEKYVYNQKMLKDSIEASGIDKYIHVDYFMRGCPIIKDEFINFLTNFCKDCEMGEFVGPVCNECPRRGKNCFLVQKVECMGAFTHGGCNAICPSENIPCILCRGPLDKDNFAAEINLFKKFGLSEKDIMNKLRRFGGMKE